MVIGPKPSSLAKWRSWRVEEIAARAQGGMRLVVSGTRAPRISLLKMCGRIGILH